jgi:hypothetical protein
MTKFTAHGPFEVPNYRGPGGRTVRAIDGREFFNHHKALAPKRGCYVFGIRAGRGITPVYVGKATISFEAECFAVHKLSKYNESLADYARGTPVLFFVTHPDQRGRVATNRIRDLELFLIQAGVAANADLLNVRGTQAANWAIEGVIRSRVGRPTSAATAFRNCMKLFPYGAA